MGAQLVALLRDMAGRLPEALVRRAIVAAAPWLLAVLALVFLAVAGVSLLACRIGLPWAALIFSAGFAALALAAVILGRVQAARRRRRAQEARARLAAEIAAARAVLGTAGVVPAIVAFLAAFALARRG